MIDGCEKGGYGHVAPVACTDRSVVTKFGEITFQILAQSLLPSHSRIRDF